MIGCSDSGVAGRNGSDGMFVGSLIGDPGEGTMTVSGRSIVGNGTMDGGPGGPGRVICSSVDSMSIVSDRSIV